MKGLFVASMYLVYYNINVIDRRSEETKDKAILLRKQGKTFRQIARVLHLPLSTTHLWTKSIKLTKSQLEKIKSAHKKAFQVGRKLGSKKQHLQTQVKTKKFMKIGKQQVGRLSKRELTLVGAALYWSEGFKKDSRLGFSNSDPKMIKLFLRWLFKIGKVPKKNIRLRVGINQSYRNRSGEIQKEWSRLINVPLSQFQKPFFQKTSWKKSYRNRNKYLGVLRVRANKQKELFLTILGMIEGLKQARVAQW